jgi:hypothetical protein
MRLALISSREAQSSRQALSGSALAADGGAKLAVKQSVERLDLKEFFWCSPRRDQRIGAANWFGLMGTSLAFVFSDQEITDQEIIHAEEIR